MLRRLTLMLACLMAVAASLFARERNPKSIIRMGNARVESFDEGWRFARYGLQADGTRIDEPANLQAPNADDSGWRRVDLPHDFAIEGPFRIELPGETGKLPYQGIGWYRKHFIPELAEGERLYIDFDGAMCNAEVWLNGRYVGTWPFGYNSFRLDLTPHLKRGEENVLAVRLDTEHWESRWYSGAGLYRHVWLVTCNPVHVGHWGTYITTPEVSDREALVNIETSVENYRQMTAEARVVTRIYELDSLDVPGKQVAEQTVPLSVHACGQARITQQLRIPHPRRWDITAPNRYLARTQIVVDGQVTDTYNTPFGVRTIRFSAADGFQLNGRKVYIQGVCNHHDLGSLGAAFNKSALKRQLDMLREMGCNSIRTSHNPPAPELLELADKMGLLVWDETFDAWRRGKRRYDYSHIFDEWHERDILAMVRRDRNHPSVIIWSIGNEVLEQREIEITKQLADIIRRADPTRPISNGFNSPDAGRATGAATALDLMGVNYSFGQQAKWESDPRYKDMPTIGSETSSCISSRGEYFFGTHQADWQMSSYDLEAVPWGCTPDEQFRTLARFPRLLGEYVWTGFDYIGEPTPYNSDETNLLNFRNDPTKKKELEAALDSLRAKNPPSRSSYFGIIDLAGFPKDRYYMYQSQWRPTLPMAHILPHWNWPGREGQVTPVHVYTSGDEAELFLNGKSLGRRTMRPGQDFRMVWDSVRYQPGTLRVVVYKQGKKWAEDEVKTTGKASTVRLTADRTAVDNDGSELAFITATITDKQGRMVPRSNQRIRFSIEGEGEIVSTDNGNAIDFTPFQSHERNAYNGLALVIVRARKGHSGTITVKAEAEGLKAGRVTLRSE